MGYSMKTWFNETTKLHEVHFVDHQGDYEFGYEYDPASGGYKYDKPEEEILRLCRLSWNKDYFDPARLKEWAKEAEEKLKKGGHWIGKS